MIKHTRSSISNYRKIKNFLFFVFCFLVSLISIMCLCLILATILTKGLHSFNFDIFTKTSPSPLIKGGLSNAIIGSLLMNLIAILIATPVGILIATYLSDFSSKSKFASLVRFFSNSLLSFPSILLGLLIYIIIVIPSGHFSGWAGSCALAFLALPMIIRSSEDILYLVPRGLKEAAVALGVPRWKTTLTITYKVAKTGLITAVILALSRIFGETAPLLFTASNNSFLSFNLNQPMSSLAVSIYEYAMSPYPNWQNLAWQGSFIIVVFILSINLTLRVIYKTSLKTLSKPWK